MRMLRLQTCIAAQAADRSLGSGVCMLDLTSSGFTCFRMEDEQPILIPIYRFTAILLFVLLMTANFITHDARASNRYKEVAVRISSR